MAIGTDKAIDLLSRCARSKKTNKQTKKNQAKTTLLNNYHCNYDQNFVLPRTPVYN